MRQAVDAAKAVEESIAEFYDFGDESSFWIEKQAGSKVIRGVPIGMAIALMSSYFVNTIMVLMYWKCCHWNRGVFNLT